MCKYKLTIIVSKIYFLSTDRFNRTKQFTEHWSTNNTLAYSYKTKPTSLPQATPSSCKRFLLNAESDKLTPVMTEHFIHSSIYSLVLVKVETTSTKYIKEQSYSLISNKCLCINDMGIWGLFIA